MKEPNKAAQRRKMPEHKKKLEFLTQNNEGWNEPVWQECEVINATCPRCKNLMVVIQAQAEYVYACCQSCGKYFIGN